MDSKEKIVSAFKNAGKPLKAGEVADAAQVDKKEVDKIIKELVGTGEVISPKRCFYELKK
ncbi:hypothetical protein [Alistipes sp. ZOR0009]|jgi:hypothetical protein|uniref:hypothetical protein n=1 Tax=Alistipes sp. ZOR0009 TaxID=1339253 RepID=UPI0006491392|nr:hypothetical protein [Alistipes sp. ZOR0009]